MDNRLLKVGLIALAFALFSGPAFAQGGATSAITGVVVDSGGGVIPGATVTATNDATAGVYTAVTNASGAFTIPADILMSMPAGSSYLSVLNQAEARVVLGGWDLGASVSAVLTSPTLSSGSAITHLELQ